MYRQLKNPKFYFMILCDSAIFVLALVAAYLIRFEFAMSLDDIWQLRKTLLWIVPLKLFIFFGLGLYRGMWRFTGVRDFWKLAQACFVSMLLIMAIVLFIYRFEGFSRAVFILDGGLTFFLAGGLRMGTCRQGRRDHAGQRQGAGTWRRPRHLLERPDVLA